MTNFKGGSHATKTTKNIRYKATEIVKNNDYIPDFVQAFAEENLLHL